MISIKGLLKDSIQNFFMKRIYSLLFLSYLLLAFINYFFPFSDFIKSFIALPSMLLLPMQFGFSLITCWEKLTKKKLMPQSASTAFVFLSWCTGTIAIVLLSVLFVPLGSFNAYVVLLLVILASLLSLPNNMFDRIMEKSLRSTGSLYVLTSACMGILPFIYIRLHSSFPYMLAFDQFGHSMHIIQFLEGHLAIRIYDAIYALVALPSQMFNITPLLLFWSAPLVLYICLPLGVYLFTYQVSRNRWLSLLSAVVSAWAFGGGMVVDMHYFLNRNIIYVLFPISLYVGTLDSIKIRGAKDKCKYAAALFVIPVLFYVMVSPAFYCTTLINWPGSIKMLLSPFYALAEPAVFMGLPMMSNQHFYALMVAVVIFLLLRQWLKIENLSVWFLLSLTAFFFHLEMGLVFSILFLLYILLPLLNKNYGNLIRFTVLSLSAICFLYFLFRWLNIDNIIVRYLLNAIEAIPNQLLIGKEGTGYIFDFSWKVEYLKSAYSTFILLLSAVGLVSSIKDFSKNKWFLTGFFLSSIIAFLYLLPYPYAFRLLTFLTPFIGFYSAYAVSSFYSLVHGSLPGKNWVLKIKGFTKRIRLRPLLFLLILSLVLVPSLTSAYDYYIKYFSPVYNYEGNLTTYTPLDIEAAKWLKKNTPYETIIVSDPYTINILGSLSGIGYTTDGRMFVTDTATAPIPNGAQNLFKEITRSFTYQKLVELNTLYDKSDELKGINFSSSREMVVVINGGKAAAWLAGKDSSVYLPFETFSGFERLFKARSLELAYNQSGQYYIFKAKQLNLEMGRGPSVQVSEIGNISSKSISTQYNFYEYLNANFTLSLSGFTSYNVTGYPLYWSYVETLLNGSLIRPKENWDANKYILIDNVSSSDNVTIIWNANLWHQSVGWSDHSFLEGWSQSGVIRTEMEGYGFSSDGNIVSLFLENGEVGDYTSIIRRDLNIDSALYPTFSARLRGSDNSRVIIYLLLEDGTRVYVNQLWFKPTIQWLEITENVLSKTHGADITAINICYKTIDGKAATTHVDYLMFSTDYPPSMETIDQG